VTQQEIFDRTVQVEQHIKHLPLEARLPISALISWSAFNAGMARTGVGLVSKLATTTGWEELQTVLGLDSYGVTEAGALSTAVWKFVRGQEPAGGRCSCQALGSLRYSPQAQSRASSGSPIGRPLGNTESAYPSRLAR
jgi:hypothetical protein